MKEAFRVIEPDGRTYRMFAEGLIEGFAEGAVIVNYIPSLLASASMSQQTMSPTKSDIPPPLVGAEHVVAPQEASGPAKMRAATDEK